MDRVVHRSILKNSKTWGKNLAVVIKRICIIAYGTATAALHLDGIQPKMQDKGDKYCQYTFVKAHQTVGEGNGNPLQYSCLENPMDGGAWQAAVHGVAKSRTRLRDVIFTFHFSLSCIGEGNGNPLQCSCLENPRDNGAWWAAISGVAESRTPLKQLSSSSSSRATFTFFHRYISLKPTCMRKTHVFICSYCFK